MPKLLSDLEPLLCSGLGSKHVSIANISIKTWKDIFGSFKGDLQYPPMIKEVLSKLLPMADIHLSTFSQSSGNQTSDNHRQHPVFLDTQTDSNILNEISLPKISNKAFSSNMIQPQKQKIIGSSPRVVIGVSKTASRKRSCETTPEPGKRKSRKKSSVAKLRHDDSQIQFEAIAGSSPTSEAAYDSQLLTERQKEVRERQAGDAGAAMFSDIRSSPRPHSRPSPKVVDNEIELPSYHSNSKLRLETPTNSERQSTPDTQVIENQDTYLASSPTPARGISTSRDLSCPPSSPPGVAVHAHNRSAMVFKDNDIAITSSPPQAKERSDVSRNSVHKGLNQFEQSSLPLDFSLNKSALVALNSSDEYNVTSFPTYIPNGSNNNAIVDRSLDTPTQEIPYSFDPNQTLSTYRSTPRHSGVDEDMDATVEFTCSAEQAGNVNYHQSSTDNGASNDWEIQVAETFRQPVVSNNSVLPSTRRRSQRGAAAIQSAPNTPTDVIIGTGSSLASSDKIPSGDVIYEDAVSSPQALPSRIQMLSEAIPIPNGSSPLSDVDESSLMRLVESVDQKLAENGGRVDPPTNTSTELATVSLNAVLEQTPSGIQGSRRRSSACPVSQSSTIMSVIPETPAPQPLKKSGKDNLLLEPAADDSDAGSVIIVEHRVVNHQIRPTNTSKSPKSPRRKTTAVKIKTENEGEDHVLTKKRKLDEILDIGSSVPDSQEASGDGKCDISFV